MTMHYASPSVLYVMYESFDDPDQSPVQKWPREISHSVAQRISIHFAGQVRFDRLCENGGGYFQQSLGFCGSEAK